MEQLLKLRKSKNANPSTYKIQLPITLKMTTKTCFEELNALLGESDKTLTMLHLYTSFIF